jgi:hypothetical protein
LAIPGLGIETVAGGGVGQCDASFSERSRGRPIQASVSEFEWRFSFSNDEVSESGLFVASEMSGFVFWFAHMPAAVVAVGKWESRALGGISKRGEKSVF